MKYAWHAMMQMFSAASQHPPPEQLLYAHEVVVQHPPPLHTFAHSASFEALE